MYKKGDLTKKAKELNIRPKTYIQNLLNKGIKHIPNYTEMELYLLSNFHYKACSKFITHKTLNALKIKQWRIIKSHSN